MEKGREYLMRAKDPNEYIKRCILSSVPRGKKAVITHEWLVKTGYSIDDIAKARSMNPYWKKRRLKGNVERTKARIKEYDFSVSKQTGWNEDLIIKFVLKNERNEDGSYKIPDYQLAKYFQTTIPAIQYMRRKHNLMLKVMEYTSEYKIIELMEKSENAIKHILKELEK